MILHVFLVNSIALKIFTSPNLTILPFNWNFIEITDMVEFTPIIFFCAISLLGSATIIMKIIIYILYNLHGFWSQQVACLMIISYCLIAIVQGRMVDICNKNKKNWVHSIH